MSLLVGGLKVESCIEKSCIEVRYECAAWSVQGELRGYVGTCADGYHFGSTLLPRR